MPFPFINVSTFPSFLLFLYLQFHQDRRSAAVSAPAATIPMPARKGLLAPQNTFLDTIATRFDGTRKLKKKEKKS